MCHYIGINSEYNPASLRQIEFEVLKALEFKVGGEPTPEDYIEQSF